MRKKKMRKRKKKEVAQFFVYVAIGYGFLSENYVTYHYYFCYNPHHLHHP
jgi:hypothetical protein